MGANATKSDTGVSPDETGKPSNGTVDSNMTAKAPCVEPRESKQAFQVTAAGPSAAIEASKNETPLLDLDRISIVQSSANGSRDEEKADNHETKDDSKASPEPAKKIHVCVRIRPLNRLEKRTKQQVAWRFDDHEITQTRDAKGRPAARRRLSFPGGTTPAKSSSGCPRPSSPSLQTSRRFRFDAVVQPEQGNDVVQSLVADGVVARVMQGYHACIFAYGQTTAGKTHTIQGRKVDPGILPRSLEAIFQHIEDRTKKLFILRVSFFEIYNEVVNDLLNPQNVNLRIREDAKRGVFVQGLTEEVVMTAKQVISLLSAGQSHRHVGRTNFNRASSRSHVIFRLVVESARRENASKANRRSVLNVVDLAGSENTDKAGRDRVRETSCINKSLCTLAHVIKRLSERKRNASVHVPYRDSKLTRILQDSLSGKAVVSVVCCVSPSSGNVDETISTLKFASRAKRIKVAPVKVNYDERTLLKKYTLEIARLRQEVARLKAEQKSATLTSESGRKASKTPPGGASTRQPAVSSTGKDESKQDSKEQRPSIVLGLVPSARRTVEVTEEDIAAERKRLEAEKAHEGANQEHIMECGGDEDSTMTTNQSNVEDLEAKIERLTRIILRSSKAHRVGDAGFDGIETHVDQVIARKLSKGVISLDEYAHIQQVMQKAQLEMNDRVETVPSISSPGDAGGVGSGRDTPIAHAFHEGCESPLRPAESPRSTSTTGSARRWGFVDAPSTTPSGEQHKIVSAPTSPRSRRLSRGPHIGRVSKADSSGTPPPSAAAIRAVSPSPTLVRKLRERVSALRTRAKALKAENDRLRKEAKERDEALNEWVQYYTAVQNRAEQFDDLSAQMLTMEATLETAEAKHREEKERLIEELTRLKAAHVLYQIPEVH